MLDGTTKRGSALDKARVNVHSVDLPRNREGDTLPTTDDLAPRCTIGSESWRPSVQRRLAARAGIALCKMMSGSGMCLALGPHTIHVFASVPDTAAYWRAINLARQTTTWMLRHHADLDTEGRV